MATILLGAAGAAFGAGFGGTVLGLSGAIIGRAVGATLGRIIDQRLLGSGSEPVETGRVDRFRLMGASEGSPVGQIYGRVRVSGQVIWATRFEERQERSGGGKGAPKPAVTQFTYSVSMAVALCEGTIAGIGRIWGDGIEMDPGKLNLRVYTGDEAQLPDPKIEAVEGAGNAPAYRGVAYVVIEDLPLGDFGNRVPQLSFEVIRPAQPDTGGVAADLRTSIRAVALLPGSGEYALATSRVHYAARPGEARPANVNTLRGKSDFAVSLEQLRTELPEVGSVSLIVSWFGDDLRCGECEFRPKVEQKTTDGQKMPWRAGGIGRAAAKIVPRIGEAPVYGGTPADASVVEAIQAIRAGGQEVMFYPFILMEQLAGNALPDPYSDEGTQPALPWRGRITTSVAPGRPGSPDGTSGAEAEVAAFFGTAQPVHFAISGGQVVYSGPAQWGYRRFILHYARLCAMAGGVDAFCIGSEMRGLTQIRGAGNSYPAVAALVQLARDVRAILPGAKISYAADWSEYFGHHVGGDVFFHLDPLWAAPEVDFIGIDNYMPLSDWRDGDDHADVAAGSIYNLDYLGANVAGGEGFDWYYDSPEGAASQRRLPIEDGTHGEPWVFRYKDLAGWWSNPHHNRIAGVRQPSPTAWVPQSKPIRFTEYGCAAIDKGTNEPNKFLDPRSSESALPRYSGGRRDDLVQMQYYRAIAAHLADPAKNPPSTVYSGQMIDADHAHAWAWDARPFPAFPGNATLWQDAANYARGHWLTGRSSGQALSQVIAEICGRSGLGQIDTRGAYGVVRGFAAEGVGTARAALQPLMLAYGFEALERNGALIFRMRGEAMPQPLDAATLAVADKLDGDIETIRAPEAEMAGKVRLSYIEAEGDFMLRQAEATLPEDGIFGVSQSELSLMLTPAEARATTERWLAEARVARDTARFALPQSAARIGAGDVVALNGADWRIDRIEQGEVALAEAVRIERSVYRPSDATEERAAPRAFVAPVPVYPLFLDLPLLAGDEVPHAPHLAVAAQPWPGSAALWEAAGSDGFTLNTLIAGASTIGVTETSLAPAAPGLWDRGEPLRVRLAGGTLSSATEAAILNGANLLAIGDGSNDRWEILQFAVADLVAPMIYDLSRRLRGQAGSDAVAPGGWPAGSSVVLLNGAPRQIAVGLAARGLARTYRIGTAARGFDDPDVVERVEAFAGIGLRPYAPVHLRPRAVAGGLDLTWVRRTRIDGDSWQSPEVPLGEDREAYLVRIFVGPSVVRETEVALPRWTYLDADRLADGASGGFAVEVAQLSDRFGPGPFRRITVAV